MGKEFKGFDEAQMAKIHLDSFRATLKKHQTGKRPAKMVCIDSGFKKYLHPDWYSHWTDAYKK